MGCNMIEFVTFPARRAHSVEMPEAGKRFIAFWEQPDDRGRTHLNTSPVVDVEDLDKPREATDPDDRELAEAEAAQRRRWAEHDADFTPPDVCRLGAWGPSATLAG